MQAVQTVFRFPGERPSLECQAERLLHKSKCCIEYVAVFHWDGGTHRTKAVIHGVDCQCLLCKVAIGEVSFLFSSLLLSGDWVGGGESGVLCGRVRV